MATMLKAEAQDEDYTCPRVEYMSCGILDECGKCCEDCEKKLICTTICDYAKGGKRK